MAKLRFRRDTETHKLSDIVYSYSGCTYGVISWKGIAVTEKDGVLPFFEVEKTAVEEA